jgi:hypothetical protein
MNNKQYFLVTKIDNQNYSIIQGPNYLPESFGPTSGFNFLEQNSPELLSDLTWQGSPNLAFWVAIFNEKPSINIDQKLIETKTLNINEKTCTISYSIQNADTSEIEIRTQQLKQSIRTIRDRYLVITDFTQSSDSPMSDAAKLDFKNFRQQLRTMLDIPDITQAVWPTIPTSAPNITIPPFPPMPSFNSVFGFHPMLGFNA